MLTFFKMEMLGLLALGLILAWNQYDVSPD